MKRVIKILGYILTALSIVFLIYRCYKLGLNVKDIVINYSTIVFSLVSITMSCLSVFLLAFCYKRIIILCSEDKITAAEADRIYCRSNIGKYLPGNVFQYVERNLFLAGHGITQSDAAAASAVEIVCLLIAGLCLSVIMNGNVIFSIISEYISNTMLIIIIILIITAIIAVLIFACKNGRFKKSFTILGRNGIGKCIFSNMFIYLLVLLLMGVSFACIICSFDDISFSFKNICLSSGAFIFSWLLGFIVIGAPGGIGIREAVLASLLGSALKIETVVASVLIGRFISVLSDVIVWGISELIYKKESGHC